MSHPAVVNRGVAFVTAVIDQEGEAIGLSAEAFHLVEGTTHEYVMECKVDGAELGLPLSLLFHHIRGREEFEGSVVGGVEAVDGFPGGISCGLRDMVQHIPVLMFLFRPGCHICL